MGAESNPRIERTEEGGFRVALLYPVEVKGGTYESLTLRRMKVRDQEATDKKRTQGTAHQELFLISSLAEVDLEVVRALDIEDYVNLQEALISLTGKQDRPGR